ncbi:LAGLIDADG family homing endonuclease [Sutcliffiella sp. NC1]|uniref:LAGLIDADG family homing endonuclease n=1 Tax=Sutcliffiella sp. NC1 TaxID=3004096 RepID=UPI0022DD6400|nr:LAGLIDADG family homing endonuclease [Sutcliffiella sp. NC1]WBL14411.1 hypothetical protein O1A01_21430 [Sutcliffiella sp. NC1]
MKEWEAAYIAGIIDGEGSITLTRIHRNEYRRPCISISSTDKELLSYIQSITGGNIVNKKNYSPEKHKDSFVLTIKKKKDVFNTLEHIVHFLRVPQKRKRAAWILNKYDSVTPRNGKYNETSIRRKIEFEDYFFSI